MWPAGGHLLENLGQSRNFRCSGEKILEILMFSFVTFAYGVFCGGGEKKNKQTEAKINTV